MLNLRYRKDYDGEFVVSQSIWTQGKKTQIREWLPNPIQNQYISGRAACIGSSIDVDQFDYKKLQKHRGGLLGSKKLQTYGTGTIAVDMKLNFAVDIDNRILSTLIEKEYNKNNIVYTTAKKCIATPGAFYLIPYSPMLGAPALALYLAAFDGHNEIFMLGYNNFMPLGSDKWKEHVVEVISVYSGTRFIGVGKKNQMPDEWRNQSNFQILTYGEFISYCDV